jgi:hypothetical protein
MRLQQKKRCGIHIAWIGFASWLQGLAEFGRLIPVFIFFVFFPVIVVEIIVLIVEVVVF